MRDTISKSYLNHFYYKRLDKNLPSVQIEFETIFN